MLWFRVFVLKLIGKCFESFMNRGEYGGIYGNMALCIFSVTSGQDSTCCYLMNFYCCVAVRVNRKIGIKRETL